MVRLNRHLHQIGICGDSENGLGREVDIAREATGEIVRTKLVGRVQTVFHEVVSPLGEYLPMAENIISRTLGFTDRVGENKHVSGLFDRHVADKCLTIGNSIGPNVMGREQKSPLPGLGIMEDKICERLDQLRTIQEKKRRRRVEKTHRADETVTVTLFRKIRKIPSGVMINLWEASVWR